MSSQYVHTCVVSRCLLERAEWLFYNLHAASRIVRAVHDIHVLFRDFCAGWLCWSQKHFGLIDHTQIEFGSKMDEEGELFSFRVARGPTPLKIRAENFFFHFHLWFILSVRRRNVFFIFPSFFILFHRSHMIWETWTTLNI